ncbi:MAG: phosphatase PAP2 family protein [Candidatus Aenigmatarchaeota archaeon]
MNEKSSKIALLLIIVALNSVGYKLAQFLRPDGFLITGWLDSFVPYVSYFVVPYALYPVIAIIPFVLYWNDYKKYKVVALSFAAVLAIAIIIFLFFQTTITRAHVEPNDLFNWGVSLIYSFDEPLNAFPSLHVAIPVIATLFVYLRNRRLGLYLVPVTVLIILSTVMIKQHAVVDIIGGLILAFGVFKYRRIFEKL